jgi:redox-sensitive bicupin YhaK (pirin superfamily)
MWLAQPESTRHGPSAFSHHKDLPVADLGGADAQILAGTLGGEQSPVVTDWPLVGAELRFRGGKVETTVEPSFEHAVVPIDRKVSVNGVIVEPGALAIIPTGFESLRLESSTGRGRMMLLGGAPFPDRIQMWWNFVARTREELATAWCDWRDHNDDRFGPVPSSLDRIDAPTPIWVRDG